MVRLIFLVIGILLTGCVPANIEVTTTHEGEVVQVYVDCSQPETQIQKDFCIEIFEAYNDFN